MIVGIGCDTVQHKLTELLGWSKEVMLRQRIFAEDELLYFEANPSIRFLAGRFAVKEAVLKSLGIAMQDGFSLTDICVSNNKKGQPFLELTGNLKNLSDNMGISMWHISISHSSEYSIAFVIAEN